MGFATVWDLAADWSWMDTHRFRFVGGKTIYESATATWPKRGNPKVKVERIDSRYGIKQIRRYVDAMTPIELVPIEER